MAKTILEMRNVTKRFPGVVALDDISISLDEGEILAICGENGAGKSTLMKVLSGSYTSKDYEGEIWIDGKPIRSTSVKVAGAKGIEMVYQELNMNMRGSVAENLFVGNLPGPYGFVDYKKLYKETAEVLDEIGLQVSPKEQVANLGSGQLQMLAVMRAIQKKPRILVLDEPTSALDDNEVNRLFNFLKGLKEKGVSSIFITHKLKEVFRIADRVIVLRDGQFIASHPVDQVDENTIIEEMVGRKLENLYPKFEAEIGETVLEVENLTIPHPTIKGRNIIENVSFSLRKGEILGIGGLVGSGRSEVVGALYGQLTEGVSKSVKIQGKACEISNPRDAMAAGIGYVTEERKKSGYVDVFNVRQNLTLASLKLIPRKYFIDKPEEKKFAKRIFDRLNVRAPSIETSIIELSGGNQQKVVLGKALLSRPQILLVDEPTKGIDVGAKVEIYKILNELAMNGTSIILVSSELPELISMSDRCLVICGGRITGLFDGGCFTQDDVMRAAIAH